jgi:hypothetical protein
VCESIYLNNCYVLHDGAFFLCILKVGVQASLRVP